VSWDVVVLAIDEVGVVGRWLSFPSMRWVSYDMAVLTVDVGNVGVLVIDMGWVPTSSTRCHGTWLSSRSTWDGANIIE